MYKLICILTDYFFSKKNLNNIYFIKCDNHKIIYLLDFFGFIFFFIIPNHFHIYMYPKHLQKSFFFFLQN